MSVYMTEEEQLEAIKNWWKKYSTLLTVVFSIVLLLIAGNRYWNWHQNKISVEASITYENMVVSFANNKFIESQGYANTLLKNHSKSSYADSARLLLAKQKVEANQYEEARQLLKPVAQAGRMPVLQNVARARLARLYMVNKQYKEALAQLETIQDISYQPLVNELKGDIYTVMGESDKALDFYSVALKEAREKNMGNLFLEMKTNELAANNQQAIARQLTGKTV